MEPREDEQQGLVRHVPNFAGPFGGGEGEGGGGGGDEAPVETCHNTGCLIMRKNFAKLQQFLATAQTYVETVHTRNEAVVEQCNNYTLQINTLIAQIGNLTHQNNVLADIVKVNVPHHGLSGVQFRDVETQCEIETKTTSTMHEVAQQNVEVQCDCHESTSVEIQCDIPIRAGPGLVDVGTQHYGIAEKENEALSAEPDGSKLEMVEYEAGEDSLGSESDGEGIDSADVTTETESEVADTRNEAIRVSGNGETVSGGQSGEDVSNAGGTELIEEQESCQIGAGDEADGGTFDPLAHPILERNIHEDIQERAIQAVEQHGIILDVDVEATSGSYFSRQNDMNWTMRELVARYGRPAIPLEKLPASKTSKRKGYYNASKKRKFVK